MHGRMQAVMTVSILAFLSLLVAPLSLFSAAAVALVALRTGLRESCLVMLSAAVAIALLGALIFNNYFFAVAYALGFWVPVCLVALFLRASGKIGLALEVTLIMGLCVIGGIYLFGDDPALFWQHRLQTVLQPILENPPSHIDLSQFELGINSASHYMTGIVATGTVSSVLLALLLARWWQSILFNPGGFRKEFLTMRSDAPVAYACLLIFLLAGLMESDSVGVWRNMSILAFFFFLIIGVSVLHCVVSVTKQKRVLLPLMYAGMLFIPHLMLPIALMGFTDTWLNWRRKLIEQGAV